MLDESRQRAATRRSSGLSRGAGADHRPRRMTRSALPRGRAQAAGFQPVLLGSSIDQPAEKLAREHAALVRERRASSQRLALISGGETTVRLPRRPGGADATPPTCSVSPWIWPICAGIARWRRIRTVSTASADMPGAWIDPQTLRRAQARGLDGEALLAQGDSYRFFAELDQLLVTGPTRTNVNDLRIILIDAG